MKKILFFFLVLSPVSSYAAFDEWLTTQLNARQALVLKIYTKLCSYAPGGCNGWVGKKTGVYVVGNDGNAIYQVTSDDTGISQRWAYVGGSWSYEGKNWSVVSGGVGGRYAGQLCSRSFVPYGIIAAKTVCTGDYTHVAQCNFSPNTAWPYDYSSEWFDSNVCNGQYDNTSWSSQYEVKFSGDDNRQCVTLVCNQHATLGTFSEFNAIELPGYLPASNFDNQSVIDEIYSGYQYLVNSSTAIDNNLATALQSDVASAISYLTGGVVSTMSVGTDTYFNNPFEDIVPTPSYSVAVSSVYIVGISSVVVDVNVVSSVSVAIDWDNLETIVSTPAVYEAYSSTISSSWVRISSVADSLYGSLSDFFDGSGYDVWDGCFQFDTGSIPIGGKNLGNEPVEFCLSSIPGWDGAILPIFKLIFLLGTFFAGLWWVFE